MDSVTAFAEANYGLITRADALQLGMSESAILRRIVAKHWTAVHPSVYRIAGAPVTGRQRALAATMWTGGVVSFSTGGRMLRLDGVRANGLHVTTDYTTPFRSPDVHLHRTTVLPDIDKRFVDGIPCTSATRTIVDLASELDDEALETAFESARRMGLSTPTLLERRVPELCGRGRPGSDRVRRLLARVEARPLESRLEVKFARLLRESRLPVGVRQYRLGHFRLDVAWLRMRVAAECDGFERHGSRLAWKRDRKRLAAIEALQWRVVNVTWDDVTLRPQETVERLAFALGVSEAA